MARAFLKHMKKYQYIPSGVCSRLMEIGIDDDGRIASLEVTGGCHGNLQGIGALLRGMKATEAVERLRGIRCGAKATSCPDQIAAALTQITQQ